MVAGGHKMTTVEEERSLKARAIKRRAIGAYDDQDARHVPSSSQHPPRLASGKYRKYDLEESLFMVFSEVGRDPGFAFHGRLTREKRKRGKGI